ncbi:MAG: hypothetical protein LBU41_01995, partial [Clostridiales Family XIII bacterium]|nr:hypothetical protein [Clostridiales Family XIII bacterium]
RPEFFGKKAFVVSTCVRSGGAAVSKYMARTLGHWGYSKVSRLNIRRAWSVDPTPSMLEKMTKKAEEHYEEAISGVAHQPSFRQLFYFAMWQKINSSEDATEANSRYWREAGLLDRRYAPQIHLNPFFKVAAVVIRCVVAVIYHIWTQRK